MIRYLYVNLGLVLLSMMSCNSNNTEKVKKSDYSIANKVDSNGTFLTRLEHRNKVTDSSLFSVSDSVNSTKERKRFKEYIIQCPPKLLSSLKQHMQHIKNQWENVSNPIQATYIGNDYGDYHHVLFKTRNNIVYDFGQANNNYGEYNLHESTGQMKDNPKYLGQMFNVYWDWKSSEFLCCEGEYIKVKAYLPSIIKLEMCK